jgi:lysozyme family protein
MPGSSFPVWWQFVMLPDHDGLAADGPDTRWGWVFETWVTARRWQGMTDCSRTTFNAWTQAQFGTLAQAFFWNRQSAPLMPYGVDVSVIDWTWTSGGAVYDIQRWLGFTGSELDGMLGPKTVAALIAKGSPADVAQTIHTMRVQYYEDIGIIVANGDGTYSGDDPGLGYRADDCLTLAMSLIGSVG